MLEKFVRLIQRVAKNICQEFECRKYIKMSRHSSLNNAYERIYFYHIRKAAGTSLNHMFLSSGGEPGGKVYARLVKAFTRQTVSNGLVFAGWDKKLIEKGNYYYAFSHLPFHRVRLPKNTFSFTCLRDPVSRVLSHYKMLEQCRQSLSPPLWFNKEKMWLGNTFNDFLDKVPKVHLLTQLFMFSKEYDIEEAFDRIMGCTCFIFTEKFDQGVQLLSSRTGCTLEPIHTRKASFNFKLEEIEMERLRALLEPEYQLYNRLKKTSPKTADSV